MDKLYMEDISKIILAIDELIYDKIGIDLDSKRGDVIWTKLEEALDDPYISTGEWRNRN